MKQKLITLSFILCCIYGGTANAWVYSENVTISNMTQWQDDAPIYFSLSNGTQCYVPATEKNMYSLILSAFAAGKKLNIHCHDSSEDYGGFIGHRVHRLHTY